MPRIERFTFTCNEDERRMIEKLAADLSRSQSDAVRFVVMQAARNVEKQQAEALPVNIHPTQTIEGMTA